MGSKLGSGSGSHLPTPVLILAGICTLVAVFVSAMSIFLQLKSYRKPLLQRMVIRIMVMVPIYAIASLISIFSLEAAFVIDAIRDIYEAFVIYCFFMLLLDYLGGERSLLILLHGRPPKEPVFPANLFMRELDVSDPYMFLFLKRGILQYVQVKPVLAIVTLILKAVGKYNEGDFRVDSGYLYVSIVYNTSICLALYCLAVFWMCVNEDLKPFRPVPKFLCVKGILFFSFWQAIAISIMVSAGIITKLGPYTDAEHISLGLTDTLICIEMPFFAVAHMYAFSYKDFIDPHTMYVARMPILYAIRDAFGLLDVLEDSKATLRGEGMDYREFEPSEGLIHQGVGRDKRIRAGLRYSKGGKAKYWLPRPNEDTIPPGTVERGVNHIIKRVAGRDQGEEVYAPLLGEDADDVVHLAPDLEDEERHDDVWASPTVDTGYSLPFGDIDEADEEVFEHARNYVFGDYMYPCIDVSSESARLQMWEEEERVLRDERGAWFSPIRGSKGQHALDQRREPAWQGYGAVGSTPARPTPASIPGVRPPGAGQRIIDIEQEGIAGDGDVRLKWTKPDGGRRSALKASPGSSVAESSSSGSKQSTHTPPAISRQSSAKGKSKADSPVLPPDAVDLVVEDHEATQEDLSKERRKGEPASKPVLRKVYRRGFVTTDEEGHRAEGEIEVDDEREAERTAGGRVEVGEEILQTLGDEGENARKGLVPDQRELADEGPIATVETPPLHARIYVDRYGHEEENPWA